jgi:ketosteroid isomerase-like protein
MMLRQGLLGVFIATLGVMACSAAPADLTQAERAVIASAVEARVNGYVDAARRRDVSWFLDFWADTDDFVLAGDGNLVGYAAWADQLRKAVADTREILDFEFFNRHTYVLARDAAVHTTQFRWALVQANGDTLRMHGSWSYVFKDFDGVWRVVHSAGTHLSD